MSIVEIHKLNKKYPTFKLSDISFNIEDGRITGFIGRNGAGKTTTIKSMLNLVHPDSGEILYFGTSLVSFITIGIGEALHHFPRLDFLNAFGTEHLAIQLLLLLAGIFAFALLTFAAYCKSCERFEKIDL